MTTCLESAHEPRKPGRPRSAQAHQATLDATLALLAEVGLQSLSIEQIAMRAAVGKKTIYRRWSSKEALVSDAIRSIQSDMPVIDTGNLRDDLLTMYRTALDSLVSVPVIRPLYLKLASEFYSHPAIFYEFLTQHILPRFQQFSQMVQKAQVRGEIRQDLDLDLVIDILIGPTLFHWMFTNMLRPASPPADVISLTEQIVDLVLPCLAGNNMSTCHS